MLNLATVIRRRTARSKSQTSGRVLGSNWEPRMKKRRVSKRIANSFTVLLVRQLALALWGERRFGKMKAENQLTSYFQIRIGSVQCRRQ